MNEKIGMWPQAALFLSGVAGLIYEVVWARQLLLIFGSTTESMVAVVAAFMAGLAIGSLVLGKAAGRAGNPLLGYAILEIAIGVSAGASQWLFGPVGETYRGWAAGGTAGWGLLKLGLASAVLLPPTIAMGGTLPMVVEWVSRRGGEVARQTARLYAVNTWGAFLGATMGGFVLIELLGLRGSVLAAAVLNLAVGGISWVLAGRGMGRETEPASAEATAGGEGRRRVLTVLGLSGLISLSYQVFWTRMLLPISGTFVYSLAMILGLYLLGIAVGSRWFEGLDWSRKSPGWALGMVEVGIGIMALMTVVVNSGYLPVSGAGRLLLTILPGTILMGMSFPIAIRALTGGEKAGGKVGVAYGVNTIGAIAGTYAAAYVIIGAAGAARGTAVLAIGNMGLGAVMWLGERGNRRKGDRWLKWGVILGMAAGVWLAGRERGALLEAGARGLVTEMERRGGYEWRYKEDEVASVLGYRDRKGREGNLIIDGVATTNVGPETALLAHVPLVLHPRPEKMLVVAMGMGTTFRSALLHPEVEAEVVELVPSVPGMMDLFHEDAAGVLANPRGKVIVNDGRNYIKLTQEKYDVVVVDPPPPVNASGTTVLYSREFYQDIKKRLKPGGLVTAWFFADTRRDDMQMLWRSFYEVFDQILVLRSPTGAGYYLVGSEKDLVWKTGWEKVKLPFDLLADVNRTSYTVSPWKIEWADIEGMYLGDEKLVEEFSRGARPVTDDRPGTEYYAIRYGLAGEPKMEDKWLVEIRESFGSSVR